jgi:uncharacterized membrane protein YdbT with pleckstrin-like domain
VDIKHEDNLEAHDLNGAQVLNSLSNEQYQEIKSPVIRPAYRAMWREVTLVAIVIVGLFMLIEPVMEVLGGVMKSLNMDIPSWITQKVWDISMYLSLFLSWIVVCRLWYFKYSCELTFTKDSIEIKKGIFATKTIQIKMTHVTAVETSQTIIDKILGVGSLEIGSSSTSEMEIVMPGISNPNDVAKKIKNMY